jgi:lipopolysaccharide transport system ATP-binding protein
LIDEVLAVGDAEFQRKCLGKMSDVAQSGRTVLFVSHNMAAIQSLCRRTVLLEKGHIVQDGESAEVVARYLKGFDIEAAARDVSDVVEERQGNGDVRLQRIEVRSSSGDQVSSIVMGDTLALRMKLRAARPATQVFASVTICDAHGQTLCQVDGQQAQDWSFDMRRDQAVTIEARIPQLRLAPGRYSVNVWVHRVAGRLLVDYLPRVVSFDVLPADVFGTGQLPKGRYVFYQNSQWNLLTH